MPGATSQDVHAGLGQPGSGQTSAGLAHDGKGKREKEPQGLTGQATGGSGMHGDESAEARRLQSDRAHGPNNAREHNASFQGAESAEPVHAEQVASMGQGSRKEDYDRGAENPPGRNS